MSIEGSKIRTLDANFSIEAGLALIDDFAGLSADIRAVVAICRKHLEEPVVVPVVMMTHSEAIEKYSDAEPVAAAVKPKRPRKK